MQHVVSGTPDGEVRYAHRSSTVASPPPRWANDPAAEVTLTQTYADAVLIARAQLDGNVAFMQGRVKVVGDMGKVMALMPLTDSDEYRPAVAELAGQTAF